MCNRVPQCAIGCPNVQEGAQTCNRVPQCITECPNVPQSAPNTLQDAPLLLQGALSYHMKLFSQPLITTPMSRMRAYRECLVILGAGYLDNTLCANVLAAPTSRSGQLGPFVSLNPTRDRRYFATVASINDFGRLRGFVFLLTKAGLSMGDATDGAILNKCDPISIGIGSFDLTA